jgi:peptidyl-prolyl cis-trans isomerase D
MFDFVTKHKRWIQLSFVLLIVPPFAFFGMESYTRSMRGGSDIATVDGVPITQQEFGDAMRQQQERLREALGAGFDPAVLDTPDMRQALLDSLINQRVVSARVFDSGLTASNDSLQAVIRSMPGFQRDGKFDEATANAQIRARGMSGDSFAARLRHDIAVGQLTQAIGETGIGSRAVAERIAMLLNQRREIAEARIPAEQFIGQVKIDEAQVKAHYDSFSARYRTPERVKAEYLVLSLEDLGMAEGVTDAEIKAAYDARASQYAVAEQRRASHILIPAGPDAKQKATEILAEVRKSPARFAELAKKYSQDTGSAEKGGDLGLFGRGMMVKPFEDAVFSMKQGEIAGPVESEFGFHIIQLTEVKAGKARPLEEVRKELAAELAKQKGAKKFSEIAEAFGNMVYEQSDSLKPAAEKYKLKLQATGWIARGGAPDLGLVGHPKVLAALFSKDSIEAKRNTDAIEITPGVLVAARVIEHQPEQQRPLADVKGEIEATLKREEAAKLAQKDGAAKLEQLAKGGDAGLTFSQPKAVTMREAGNLPADVQRKILAADPKKLPAHFGADRGDQGYVIYRVVRALPEEPRTDVQKTSDVVNAHRLAGALQFESWLAAERASAKIEINRANLEKK